MLQMRRLGRGMPSLALSEETTLPGDGFAGALAARIWRPDVGGPSVAAVRVDGVFDVSGEFPTMRDLCEVPSPAAALRGATGPRIGALSEILAHTPRDKRADDRPRLLAPIDLQAIKAAGVTFAQSLLERIIEERAHGSRGARTKRARGDRGRPRRGTEQPETRLSRRHAAQEGADRGGRLVAISRSRHRPRR